MLGIGAMIQTLSGNEEIVDAIKSALNKTIEKVWLEENELLFEFTDGTNLKLYDNGQSCCEDRYMRTDDNLSEYEGAKLLDFELKNAPSQENIYGAHEIQFLDVITDKGIFQMANHNEHNGYYGGFWIVARVF